MRKDILMIATGIVVIVISIAMINKGVNFWLFVVVGAIFVLFGGYKTLMSFPKKVKKGSERVMHHAQKNQVKHEAHQKHKDIRYFYHKCGNVVRTLDNFCSHCGERILRK